MFINSFYLIINFTKLICHSDLFECYYSRNYITIRYFKLIAIKLLGNILKTASNITFISFSLSRYLAMTNNNNNLKIFKIIDKNSFKIFVFVTFLVSILLNIHFYFISSNDINQLDQSPGIEFETKSNLYTLEVYEEYKLNFDELNQKILNSMQIIHIIFSDIFYIILVVIIDLCLLSFVIKKMKSKKLLINQQQQQSSSSSSLLSNFVSKKRILNLKRQIKNSENRLSNLVILNGINFLLFKLPTALITFYSLIYYFDQTNKQFKPNLIGYIICRYYRFCNSLAELAYLFYLLSILIQFFIIYKLDKNFNANCASLKSIVIKKVKSAFSFRTNNSIAKNSNYKQNENINRITNSNQPELELDNLDAIVPFNSN